MLLINGSVKDAVNGKEKSTLNFPKKLFLSKSSMKAGTLEIL